MGFAFEFEVGTSSIFRAGSDCTIVTSVYCLLTYLLPPAVQKYFAFPPFVFLCTVTISDVEYSPPEGVVRALKSLGFPRVRDYHRSQPDRNRTTEIHF